jgi:hypothetical protein
MEFALGNPVALRTQTKLALVNDVNRQFQITCQMMDDWQGILTGNRQLRPVHIAIFRGTFREHGRVYTTEHGHQGLRKIERQTIRFDGEPSVELDYGGFHCRLLYHLAGLSFEDDPYCLWASTTSPRRIMAKVLVNCLINARSPRAAVAAANQKTNRKNEDGTCKEGKARRDARELWEAKRAAGVGEFKDIVPLVMKKHYRIQHFFGADMGKRLMHWDGQLCLAVLHHFAKRSIPVLGIHDSFIVPQHAQAELREVMARFYKKKFGFWPVVK